MKVIIGNILDVPTGLIVHQVNCLGYMGRGLAKDIKEKWRWVYDTYKRLCLLNQGLEDTLLGRVQGVRVKDDPLLMVVNLFSQKTIGRGGVFTNYTAMEDGLARLAEILKGRTDLQNLPVCFPYGIGCGLGGGDWSQVRPMLERFFPNGLLYSLKKVQGG